MKKKYSYADLAIIMVLYNQKISESKTYKTLLRSFQNIALTEHIDLFIYDNSPVPMPENMASELDVFNITYTSDVDNPGITKAYNEGFKWAKSQGLNWILLLDQDTEMSNNAIEHYVKAINKENKISVFAPILLLSNNKIFSPFKQIFRKGFHPSVVNPGINKLSKLTPVNSGLLLKTELFELAEGYDENIKLDFADISFIDRVKKHVRYMYVINTVFLQDFSNDTLDVEPKINRFKIYCADSKIIKRINIFDLISFPMLALVRGLSLSVKYKNYQFIKIWFSLYIVSK
jgi:GT2 family glycosyltransferase